MPILTLYRPNFCAECGAKILRLRWRIWTNRKFCDSCARSLRKQQWSMMGFVAIVLFIAGLIVGHRLRPAPPPLIIQRTESGLTNSTSTSTQSQPLTVEDTYICGARTKKGRPCSRRVHGPVRCWQHKGEKAMLPQDKLLVK